MEQLPPEALPSLLAELERWEAGTLSPSAWNRRFLPHYFKGEPADFHADLDRDLDGLHLRRRTRRSYVAPRGGAKSTWTTLAYVLRAALHGWEPYTLILSDSSDQADKMLRHVKDELEDNPHLAAVYPDLVGEGDEWKESRIRLRNGALVEGLGRGKKVRGRRNRAQRPSLVVFDDIQSNEDVDSPLKRQRAWSWATREVIPAGDETTNFLAVGSAIHRDAVSVRLGQLAGWQGHTFRAVHSWPHRMDLWDEFERLATNLADSDRGRTARAFYSLRKAEMDAGARVYWPGRFPLVEMMVERAAVGHAAFESEYQGVPGALEGAEWPAALFDRPGFFFDDWPTTDQVVMKLQSLDPSKGATDKADYRAHVTLALHRDGTFYADCDLRKEPAWCARALDLAARFHPRELVAESNNTMGLMLPEMLRLVAERPATTFRPAIREVNHGDAKITRMRALTPYLERKQLRVRNSAGGRMMVDQMRDVPNGDYDDGPDALATAILRAEVLYHGGRR